MLNKSQKKSHLSLSKYRVVARFEIIRQLKKPSFWVAILLLPVFIFGLSVLSATNSSSLNKGFKNEDIAGQTLGLVDGAHFLKATDNFKIYSSADEGLAALKSGEIDLFYHLPSDFATNPTLYYYSISDSSRLFSDFSSPIRAALDATALENTDKLTATILTKKYQISHITFNNHGEVTNSLGKALIPLVILAIFYALICVFGNRLLMTVVEEKENRISEMILTAVSAKHLIVGKIIAIITLGIIQIAILALPIISLIIIKSSDPFIAGILRSIEFNPYAILTNFLLLFLSYFFFASLCTFVGTLVPTARDASQYLGIIILGVFSPFFFISNIISNNPNLPTYFFTYFPLSSPITLMFRNAIGTLPWYELILGLALLSGFSAFILRLTIKSFEKNAINFSLIKPNFRLRKSWKK